MIATTTVDANMIACHVRLTQASQILQFAMIIREEELPGDEEAYTIAEALPDKVVATA